MKKIFYTLTFALFCSVSAFAQQESHFTHYMYNQQILNPASVGSREVPSIMALYRNQWLDIDGAPRNMLLSYSSPFLGDRVGFGLSVVRQEIGRFENWYANLAYSYGIPITEKLKVRIGLHGSALYSQMDFTDEIVVFQEGDESIMNGIEPTQLKGNVGAGIYVHSDRFYFGVSSPYFLSNQIGFNDDVEVTALKQAHFYGMAGFLLPMTEKIQLRPAFLGKYVPGAPFQLDASLSLLFNDKFSVGASYRTGGTGTGESIDFLLFLQLSRKMGLGVAYDFTLSDLKNYNNGTFELMLRYDLKTRRDDLENGRYFNQLN